ncbi:thioesterase II family protein [Micromonospora sp. NBS 11-29]|uniref:thioesterase II family protein n=1 Tax=Micromonospora sp. NBS 11-29 TaxID=1960879 RepID=UPI000B785946|nr:alpha/beta fold hydrolase [Micromonospora sp. NBS 11-29]
MLTDPPRLRPTPRPGFCPRPVPAATLRLFLFHHAGGSQLLFREWLAHFPADWEIHLFDAPGRGRLADLPFCRSAEELAECFLEEILLAQDRPFAFFGHSMGGLAAYELTQRLARERLRQPVWLGISARDTPDVGPDSERHRLPDAELRRHLASLGGTSVEVLEDEELWQLLAPVIRGDLRLVETWQPRPGAPRLTVPLSVFGGTDDVVVTPDRLAAWSAHAERFLGLHLFEGDHFYFRGRVPQFVDLLVAQIRAAAPNLAPGPPAG